MAFYHPPTFAPYQLLSVVIPQPLKEPRLSYNWNMFFAASHTSLWWNKQNTQGSAEISQVSNGMFMYLFLIIYLL